MDATWDRDSEHLKILGICYYVKAGLWAMGCLAGGMYVVMAGMMRGVMSQAPASGNPPPEEFVDLFTWLFGGIGIALVVGSLLMGALSAYVGYCLPKARRRVLCLVVAALQMPSVPIGTLLGVFTVIVLCRPSVVDRFEGRLPAPASPAEPPAQGGAPERDAL